MSARGSLFAALLLGGAMSPAYVAAQQSASLSSVPSAAIEGPTKASKTELVNRFHTIKAHYAAIRSAADKYATLAPDAPSEVKVLRFKIDAAMRSYEYYEFQTQRQRDQLNRLVRLGDVESARLQMAMDRLSKMSKAIVNLMNALNESGEAVVATR